MGPRLDINYRGFRVMCARVADKKSDDVESRAWYAQRIRVVVLVLAAAFGGGAAIDLLNYHFGPRSLEPRLYCPEVLHECGSISGRSVQIHTFHIENTGQKPLFITSVRAGCGGCIAIKSWPHDAIAKGDVGAITVEFNPHGLRGRTVKKLLVETNDPARGRLILGLAAFVLQDTTTGID